MSFLWSSVRFIDHINDKLSASYKWYKVRPVDWKLDIEHWESFKMLSSLRGFNYVE